MSRSSTAAGPPRFTLYCTTGDIWPLRLVDVTELFMHELHARGVRQHWYCSGRLAPGMARTEQINEVPVSVSSARPPDGKFDKVLNLVSEWVGDSRALLRLIREPVDVIQVRDKYFAALIAWPVARIIGAKFTIWLSFPYPEADIDRASKAGVAKGLYLRASGYLGQLLLYRFAMHRADHCFVQTGEMKKSLLRFGVREEKMTPVPMGITPRVMDFRHQRDSQQTSKADREFVAKYVEPGTQTVFYLGTLDRDRELDIMIDAFAQVLAQCPKARLLLVGPQCNDGDQQVLEARARELGILDSVVFTGRLEMEQAWKLLEHANVCWCPILNNRVLRVGSPTKLIEYMAFQKPVIANEHPEHEMVLRASGAGHCVRWSAEGFAQPTIDLLNDPKAAREMGMRGLPWVTQNRTYDSIARQVLRRYERLLDLEPGQSVEERLA